MELLKRIFGTRVLNVDTPKGEKKFLDMVLKLQTGESFQFDHAGTRFTIARPHDLIYSVVDDLGRVYYKYPIIPGITDIFG
jgi:hypothetical protein